MKNETSAIHQLLSLLGATASAGTYTESLDKASVHDRYVVSETQLPSATDLRRKLTTIASGNHYSLQVACGDWEDYLALDDIEGFLENWATAIRTSSEAESEVTLNIIKKTNDVLIYLPDHFYLDPVTKKHNVIQFLKDVNVKIQSCETLFLRCLDNRISFPATIGMDASISRSNILRFQHENCHFAQLSHYSHLTPFDFDCSYKDSSFPIQLFKAARNLLAVFFLFDVTNIDYSAKQVDVKLKGERIFTDKVSFEKLQDCPNTYYDIVQWLYSLGGHRADKLMLARNIMSIHLDESVLLLNDEAYSAILSGFEIYLKQNVALYIELKNKLSDYLIDTNKDVESLIASLSNNMKANVFGLFTLCFGLIVSSIVKSGNFDLLRNPYTWATMTVALIISLLLLFLASWDIKDKSLRLKNTYDLLKSRYTDLLIKRDLSKVLIDDNIKKCRLLLEKRRRVYFWSWFLILLIVFVFITALHITMQNSVSSSSSLNPLSIKVQESRASCIQRGFVVPCCFSSKG